MGQVVSQGKEGGKKREKERERKRGGESTGMEKKKKKKGRACCRPRNETPLSRGRGSFDLSSFRLPRPVLLSSRERSKRWCGGRGW